MDKDAIKGEKKKLKANLKARKFQEVLENCVNLLAGGVKTAEIYTYQGVSYLQQKEYIPAMHSFEEALFVDNQYIDALKGITQCIVNVGDDIVPPEKKLILFKQIVEKIPDARNIETFRKQITYCHWKIPEYELCFNSLTALKDEDILEVLHFMFTDMAKNNINVSLCYEELFSTLHRNEDILSVHDRLTFYFSFAVHLNDDGKDPGYLVDLMLSDLEHLGIERVSSNLSGASTGSYEVGIEVIPESQEWWPSKILKAQLWSLWTELEHWNGAPKLEIPADLLESLQHTVRYVGKDTCPSKTIFNTLHNMSCDNYKDVLEICTEYNTEVCKGLGAGCTVQHGGMCFIHGNFTMIFLGALASATLGIRLKEQQTLLKYLANELLEKPTFQNKALLKLVNRFRCYFSHTLHSFPDEAILTGDDIVVKAWSSLISKSQDFLTCENRHPMVEATQQYILSTTKDRHVNVEKLLLIRDMNKNNFTYSNILITVLKQLCDKGEYDVEKFAELLSKCNMVNPKNPTFLQYMGDLARLKKDISKAARLYEKSIKLEPDIKVLELLDSMPLHEPGVKEALIKSIRRVLEVKKDHNLFIRLAILCKDDIKQSIMYLQLALQLSQDPLIFELLGENYLKLGRYISAYKTFQKAYELEATAFRQNSMANILLVLGKPSEALAHFQEILSENSSYSPALLGCVKSVYHQTVNAMSGARYLHAIQLANQCISFIDQVLKNEPRWSVSLKYLGDLCVLVSELRDSKLTITNNVRKVLELGEEEHIVGEGILQLAIKCYGKGLEIQPKCSEFLLDLARSYLLLSEYSAGYLLHAATFSKRAVNLRPRDHIAWTLLGNVSIRRKDYKLAQHALIKSLNINRDENPEAWTNLGLLYMVNNDYDLANRCYGEAQSNAPKYGPCWVAQAYVARLMGYEDDSRGLLKDIVRDVNRDATVEGTLSYAVEFCRGEMSQELIHEVLTLVSRSTHVQHPESWLVHNLAGILCEKLQLYQQALQHYVRADSLSLHSSEAVTDNLQRVLCKLGSFSAVLPNRRSVWSALALMKNGQYGMSSSLLDNMSGQDVAVFQAVLCWQSRDHKTALSFLQHISSAAAALIKGFITSELPPPDVMESVNNQHANLHGKLTCLALHLTDSTDFPIIEQTSSDSLYILVKYLVAHKVHLDRAKETLTELLQKGYLKEDLYELLIDCLMFEAAALGEDKDEKLDSEVRRLVLKSYHMFPWRQYSKQMLVDTSSITR